MKKLSVSVAIICLLVIANVPASADDGSKYPVEAPKLPTSDELAKLEANADKNNADAQTDLGILYYLGRGVPKDYAKAVELWRKAAAQGNVQAENNLGQAYVSGFGVPQSNEEGAKWNLKAAEHGHPIAQFELGSMYGTGRGVPQDLVKAYVWSNLAADQKVVPAKKNVEMIVARMTPEQKTEADKQLQEKRAVILAANQVHASTPEDDAKWRACDADLECTSIQVGCWHWSPVNEKYAADMKAADLAHCLKSIDPGPQPISSCQAHMCANDPYTVAYWPKLIGTSQQNVAVTARVKACLDAAGMEPPAAYGDGTPNHFMVFPYADMIFSNYQKVDGLIREKTYAADMPLDKVMESAIACNDVVAEAKSHTK